MRNPYIRGPQTAVHAQTGEPLNGSFRPQLRNGRRHTSTAGVEPLVASNGDFNASSKRDLMQQIGTMIENFQSGDIKKTATANLDPNIRQKRAEIVAAAANDKNGPAFQALGEVIGDDVWETLGREGFARSTLLEKPLTGGEPARFRVRKKDVTAWMVTQNPQVVASQIRQSYVYPPDFYLVGNILIDDMEIAQNPGDILTEKYNDGLEAVMVQEDRIWKNLADNAARTTNDVFVFNTLTPSIFSQMMLQVSRWGGPCSKCILAYDLWNDIMTDSEFSAWFDPVSKHDIVTQGSLGSILGVEIRTDGLRYETLRVLNPGELYFCGSPQTLGGLGQRKELTANAIDQYSQGIPARGWFLEAIQAMAIVNDRAICRGMRA